MTLINANKQDTYYKNKKTHKTTILTGSGARLRRMICGVARSRGADVLLQQHNQTLYCYQFTATEGRVIH